MLNTISFHIHVEANKKQNQKNKQNSDTDNRLVVARGKMAVGWAKWVKGVKRFKIPVIKYMSWGCNDNYR